MATGARVQISGFKELDALLKGLPARVSRTVLQRAGTEAMEPMARLARSIVGVETGELQESIEVGVVAEDDMANVGGFAYSQAMRAGATQAEAVQAKRDALRAVKGQRGNYYADVFMGPVAMKHRGGATPEEKKQNVLKGFYQEFGGMKRIGKPYLRPAFEQDKAAMLARLRENIKFEVYSYLERAAKRRAGKG